MARPDFAQVREQLFKLRQIRTRDENRILRRRHILFPSEWCQSWMANVSAATQRERLGHRFERRVRAACVNAFDLPDMSSADARFFISNSTPFGIIGGCSPHVALRLSPAAAA